MKLLNFVSILFIISSLIFSACETSSGGNSSSGNFEETDQTTGDNTVPGNNTGLVPATEKNTGENYQYTFNDKIKIPSTYEGETIELAANVYAPVEKTAGEIYPLIIMMNSWALEEHEYTIQAIHFAKKGYVVLSYSQRGWGISGGKASLSGPADWADFSAVLDWCEVNLPVDKKNIGVSGISLGGGASLHAISHEPRVKTCAALSSYMDMYRSMYSEDTPRLFWGMVLCGTGALLANLDPDVYKVWHSTLNRVNIDWLRNYMAGRSPVDYIDSLNSMNKPVYISHNFEDHMFQPDVAIDYFNALTVSHKHMDLNQGTHATGELPGVLGLKNYTYDNVDRWFDYWLKGIDTGIVPAGSTSAIITMEEKNNLKRTVYDMDDLAYSNGRYIWPAKSITTQTYYCGPKGTISNGTLADSPGTEKGMNSIVSTALTYTVDAMLQNTQAGCMIMPMLEQFKIPVTRNLALMDRTTTIIYESPEFVSVKKIRGTAHATIRMSLDRSNGQIIMYLYDVNENGWGTFITHGFKTFYEAQPYYVENVEIPFVATAYDIPAGHHLALVIDTADLNYTRPDWLPFVLTLHHGEYGQSKITIPFEN